MVKRTSRRAWEIDIMKQLQTPEGRAKYACSTYSLGYNGLVEAIKLVEPITSEHITVQAHYVMDLDMIRIFSKSAGMRGPELWLGPLWDSRDFFLRHLPQYEGDGFRVVVADVVIHDRKQVRTREFEMINKGFVLHRDGFLTDEEKLVVDMLGKVAESSLPVVEKAESELMFEGYIKEGEYGAEKIAAAAMKKGVNLRRNKFIIPLK